MPLIFVMQTVKEEMLDGFYCNTLAFWAGRGLCLADAEEVLIYAYVPRAELEQK